MGNEGSSRNLQFNKLHKWIPLPSKLQSITNSRKLTTSDSHKQAPPKPSWPLAISQLGAPVSAPRIPGRVFQVTVSHL